MRLVPFVAVAILACGGIEADSKPAKSQPDKTKAEKKMTLQLTWSMKLESSRLRIDYTVKNETKSRVLIVDKLLVQDAPSADAVVVQNGTQPNTVAFTRAHVKTNAKMYITPFPTGAVLEPGATASGTAYAAWPLVAWHNFAPIPDLKPGATKAVFELGYVDDPNAQLQDVKLASGVVQTITHIGAQKLLRGNEQPLPR